MNYHKTAILLLLGCFSILSNSFSQETDFKPYIGFGVHGGVNFADANFDEGGPNSGKSFQAAQQYSGGVFINFMAEPHAGVQIELNRSNRGWVEEDTGYTYTRKASYLEIPVLTHLNFGKQLMRYNINLGPYIAFHRGFEETIDLKVPGYEVPVNDSVNSYYGKDPDYTFDFGFMIDASVGVNTSIGIFSLRARYSYGMVDMFEEYPDGIFRYSLMRNLYVGAVYTYNINLKK